MFLCYSPVIVLVIGALMLMAGVDGEDIKVPFLFILAITLGAHVTEVRRRFRQGGRR